MFMKEITITEKSKIALQLWIKAEESVLNIGHDLNYIRKLEILNDHHRILNKLSKRLAKQKIAYYYRRIAQSPIDKRARYERLIANMREYVRVIA